MYLLLLCRPDVDFDVRLMRAVQVMDIPMLKDFINALVMDSLTYGKMKISADVLGLSKFQPIFFLNSNLIWKMSAVVGETKRVTVLLVLGTVKCHLL